VTIRYFHGTGNHFHVHMEEEEGPNGEEGLTRFMKFSRNDTARYWVERTFAGEFSPETHELVFRGDVGERWFYGEGD
jgi:hypothetical protein